MHASRLLKAAILAATKLFIAGLLSDIYKHKKGRASLHWLTLPNKLKATCLSQSQALQMFLRATCRVPQQAFGDYDCFCPLTATAAKWSSDTFDCTLYTLAQRTQRSLSGDCHNSCYCFSYNASTFVYDVFLSNLNVPTKCRIGNLTESQYAEH